MKKIASVIATLLLLVLSLGAISGCTIQAIGGRSAYDVAVDNGFVGDEAAWLESLKGDRGPAGPAGDVTVLGSLYDEAVADGFEGDIFDFIEQAVAGNSAAEEGVTYAANKTVLSAVSVYALFTVTGSDFLGRPTTSSGASAGAGVIFSLDKEEGNAYVITNYHVVYDSSASENGGIASEIKLYLYGLEYADYEIPATYVGGSMNYDIAVLKVVDSEVLRNSSARAADIADSEEIAVGSDVIAVGNPEADGISVTGGIVSVISEEIEMTGADDRTKVNFRVIRVDAAVNSGNSGGGLYNKRGELIGIVNAKIATEEVENIGYAIPSNVAVNVAKNIIKNCNGSTQTTVKRCLLGITVVAADVKVTFDPDTGLTKIAQTVQVQEVTEGSVAKGVLQAGDIITKVTYGTESREVTSIHSVGDFLLQCADGDKITVEFVRDGATQRAELTLVANKEEL